MNESCNEDILYDLCIVGAGMFGSAAARHASAYAGVKVCLVGPNEPTKEERRNRQIFSSHYDEGRINYVLDDEPITQTLARNSISRYRELEELSGIQFYHPVGYLHVSKKNSPHIKKVLQAAAITATPIVDLSYHDILKRRFPFLKLNTDDHPLLDDGGAGHISPRKLVAAQKKVAKNQGCHIIPAVVNEVQPLENGIHKVITERGVVKAKRVLLCTGAFTNLKKFPIPKLKINISKETVAFLKVPAEEAERLSSMPSIIYIREEEEIGAYILPPILYPDGHYYLKIGHMDFQQHDLVETLDEVRQWYLSEGDPRKIEDMSKFLIRMLPGLKYEGISGMTCVTCSSPSGQPYIDRVSPTVTVAVVGNGKGAKLSDEIGRIAAHLSLIGEWDSELNKSHFKIILDDELLG